MFKSVESLIATNNGFFKSEKQADFLISQLSSEHGNIQVGSTYGNSFMITYFHDEKGITKKEQYNYKTSKTLVLWERVVAGKLSVQQEKELKKLQSKLKKSIKSLESRVERRSEYPGYINQVADDFTGDKAEYCKWLESLNEKGIESDKSDIEFIELKINEILS